MTKIIGLFPLSGNGGISSWTRKYLKSFPDSEYNFIPVDNSPGLRTGADGYAKRIFSGLYALRRIKKEVIYAIENEHPDILHTTTSGSLGSLRDYIIGRVCRKKKVKSVMHCRYGCIPENIKSKGPLGNLLRKAMRQFDQIWVLDSRSYHALKSIPEFSDKLKLTPNSISVTQNIEISPKKYKRIGFVGNLIPTKGLFELVEACTKCDVILDVIGPGTEEVVQKIKGIAGDKLDKTIFLHGKLPNDQAVEFMGKLDIIALPTYYPWEAFPISILEAMSNGKLVISCPRAAIPDMLTDREGNPCGLLVKEKSVDAIVEAINWAQTHTEKADEMCKAAYSKVLSSYDTSVVYDIYRNNYQDLMK